MKTALITGITGQDGSYLAELLLAKGYLVYGIIRRSSSFNTGRIDHIYKDPTILSRRCVLSMETSTTAIDHCTTQPDEIYHLGAQSHVRVSFDVPEYTGEITGLGTVRLLDAIRETGVKTRFYQASSSEMYGNVPGPLNEQSYFQPRSPYAAERRSRSTWSDVRAGLAIRPGAGRGWRNRQGPGRGPDVGYRVEYGVVFARDRCGGHPGADACGPSLRVYGIRDMQMESAPIQRPLPELAARGHAPAPKRCRNTSSAPLRGRHCRRRPAPAGDRDGSILAARGGDHHCHRPGELGRQQQRRGRPHPLLGRAGDCLSDAGEPGDGRVVLPRPVRRLSGPAPGRRGGK